MRADGGSTASDFECIKIAKLNAAKIMTNTSFEEYATLRSLVPVQNIILRLYAAGDNPSLGNPQQFFNEQRVWLAEFAKQGGVYVEILNEINLPDEGYGTFWKTPQEFALFYTRVANLIRLNFPTLKLVYPGLSPQPNAPSFIATIPALINAGLVDVCGAHSYFINAQDMQSISGGRYYRNFLGMGKPVIITEFANPNPQENDATKGEEYKAYLNSLEAGVIGAYAFVSSASDKLFNESGQTWVRPTGISQIPYRVGA